MVRITMMVNAVATIYYRFDTDDEGFSRVYNGNFLYTSQHGAVGISAIAVDEYGNRSEIAYGTE